MTSRRDPAITKLEKVARHLVERDVADDVAVAELALVSRDPKVLGMAAGRSLGRWEVLPLYCPHGHGVFRLLLRAGADAEVAKVAAEDTVRRLRIYLRRG
ncbi:MAG: hypothetical protein QM714_13225 [Nocardioides sp.]|uniref:hypothetical protein n=1 Tax=Nocardioides sp. TaxID=35761 RepID=UPI0039E4C674